MGVTEVPSEGVNFGDLEGESSRGERQRFERVQPMKQSWASRAEQAETCKWRRASRDEREEKSEQRRASKDERAATELPPKMRGMK